MATHNTKLPLIGLSCFKRGLLFFWALWFTFAFLSNFCDYLAGFSMLGSNWYFRSGNFALIISTINIYGLSLGFAHFLFLSDIVLQGLIAVLFYMAFLTFRSSKRAWQWTNTAFAVSIGLWVLFILMDEMFIAYTYEGTHSGLFMMEILSMLAIHLLKEGDA